MDPEGYAPSPFRCKRNILLLNYGPIKQTRNYSGGPQPQLRQTDFQLSRS